MRDQGVGSVISLAVKRCSSMSSQGSRSQLLDALKLPSLPSHLHEECRSLVRAEEEGNNDGREPGAAQYGTL